MLKPESWILSLFDYTTIMVQPWLEKGYHCICVDIKHPKGVTVKDKLILVGTDILTWLPPIKQYKMVFAFPPCTHLAVSGAKHFQSKGLSKLIEGLQLVERARKLCVWSKAPYMIENPVGMLSTYWRKPDYKFNPCDYAGYVNNENDSYTKLTCLWIGNGFIIPQVNPKESILGSKMHTLVRDSNERSKTPMGFAKAVYEANNNNNEVKINEC